MTSNKLRMKIKGMTCDHREVSARVKSTSLGQVPLTPAQTRRTIAAAGRPATGR